MKNTEELNGEAKGEIQANVFKNEISQFERLYDELGKVLGSIKNGLNEVEIAVSSY